MQKLLNSLNLFPINLWLGQSTPFPGAVPFLNLRNQFPEVPGNNLRDGLAVVAPPECPQEAGDIFISIGDEGPGLVLVGGEDVGPLSLQKFQKLSAADVERVLEEVQQLFA